MTARKPVRKPAAPARDTAKLRQQAELLMDKSGMSQPVTPEATEQLLHELQVHQVELKMQNDELRCTQRALEASRDDYVELYDLAPVAYCTLEETGLIRQTNLTAATLLGLGRSKLVGKPFTRFIFKDDQDIWYTLRQNLVASAKQPSHPKSCELRLLRSGGEPFWVHLSAIYVRSAQDATVWRVTLSDLTETQAARQLSDANAQLETLAVKQNMQLRELSTQLVHAEQRERERIYELLHDEVQPLLVAARLTLINLGAHTRRPGCGCCQPVAVKASDQIGQVIQIASNLSRNLNPPQLYQRDLLLALASLGQWIKTHHNLNVELTGEAVIEIADGALRRLYFNVVRELLMNVVKYAHTAHATLHTAILDDDRLHITLTDHGTGFDTDAVITGTGLAAMTQRLHMAGGSLQIVSSPGHGTIATLSLPLTPVRPHERGPGGAERRKQATPIQKESGC
jgi:PAS domain S-box-containing protein